MPDRGLATSSPKVHQNWQSAGGCSPGLTYNTSTLLRNRGKQQHTLALVCAWWNPVRWNRPYQALTQARCSRHRCVPAQRFTAGGLPQKALQLKPGGRSPKRRNTHHSNHPPSTIHHPLSSMEELSVWRPLTTPEPRSRTHVGTGCCRVHKTAVAHRNRPQLHRGRGRRSTVRAQVRVMVQGC